MLGLDLDTGIFQGIILKRNIVSRHSFNVPREDMQETERDGLLEVTALSRSMINRWKKRTRDKGMSTEQPGAKRKGNQTIPLDEK